MISPKCEKKNPSFRLKIHSPANYIHPHVDKVVNIKGETDWEAWAHLIGSSLEALGYNNDRFIVGFLLDLINTLPEDFRFAIGRGIVEGRGLNIEIKNEEGGQVLEATLPQKYEPLAGTKKTKSGLVIPNKAEKSELVLPKDVN